MMAVIDRVQNLPEDLARIVFIKELLLNDLVEELSTCAQLSDKIDICLIFKVLNQLDDTGMVKLLQNLDLLLEPLPVLYLLSRDDLHSSLLVRAPVSGLMDDTIGTTTQCCLVHLVDLTDRVLIFDDHVGLPDLGPFRLFRLCFLHISILLLTHRNII